MTSRHLQLLNLKIDIIYQQMLGQPLAAIAVATGSSRQRMSKLQKSARTDPKIVEAAVLRFKRSQLV